ncbi:MAG TPA: hypothetical protein DEH02_06670 [Bacteroidales bacterium]|nr:hypothetical protein [Bacteroidales bacterium]
MKKCLIFILFFIFSILIFSQPQKSCWLIGGSITGNIQNKKEWTSTATTKSIGINNINLNLIPKSAYFFTDKFAIGLFTDIGYSYNKQFDLEGNKNEIKDKSFAIGCGLFFRYYIPFDKLAILSEASFLYQKDFHFYSNDYFDNISQSIKNTSNKYIIDNYISKLGIGFTYYFSKQIGIEAITGFGIEYNEIKKDYIERTNRFLWLEIGLQIYLFKDVKKE